MLDVWNGSVCYHVFLCVVHVHLKARGCHYLQWADTIDFGMDRAIERPHVSAEVLKANMAALEERLERILDHLEVARS